MALWFSSPLPSTLGHTPDPSQLYNNLYFLISLECHQSGTSTFAFFFSIYGWGRKREAGKLNWERSKNREREREKEVWRKRKKRWMSKEAHCLVAVVVVRHLSIRIYSPWEILRRDKILSILKTRKGPGNLWNILPDSAISILWMGHPWVLLPIICDSWRWFHLMTQFKEAGIHREKLCIAILKTDILQNKKYH